MLADIFAEDAKRGGTTSQLQFNSVSQMYKEFMDMKFANLKTNSEIYAVKNFHLKAAFRTLFSKEIIISNDETVAVDMAVVYRLGIIEPSKSDPKEAAFVHRTFAEFLLANHLITSAFASEEYAQTSGKMVESLDLIFGTTLRMEDDKINVNHLSRRVRSIFVHLVMVKFMDFFISIEHPAGHDLKQLKTFLRKSDYYNCETLFELLIASLKVDAVNLFTFLLDVYLDFEESGDNSDTSKILGRPQRLVEYGDDVKKIILDLRKNEDLKFLVYTAAKYSSLKLLMLSCELVESVTGKQWQDMAWYDWMTNPLRYSLTRGYYQMFEYLLNFDKEKLYEWPLMHWCLDSSSGNTAEVIADKVQMIKMMLNEKPDLLQPNYRHILPSIPRPTMWHVHTELLQCLIEKYAELESVEEGGFNIALWGVVHLSSETYHQLVTILISRNEQKDLKQRDQHGFTPVHTALRCLELKTETLKLLATHCAVDFSDSNNDTGKTELDVAIDMRRSTRVINDITRLIGKTRKKPKMQCVVQ